MGKGGVGQMSHPTAGTHVTARIVGRPPPNRIQQEEHMSYLNVRNYFRITLQLP